MTLMFPKPVKQEKKRKPLKRAGKKTDAWERTRKQLIPRFAAAGIMTCELGYIGCFKDNFLSFAHSMKRRRITSQEELEECILACTSCHQIAENRRDMTEIIRGVIARRKVKV